MKGAVYLMLLASAPAALACSCIGPRPVCAEFFKTPLVFYGRVLAKKYISGPATPPGITAIGEGRFEVRDDSAWPDLGADSKQTDIWAFRNTPNSRQECADPVGITAEQAPVGPLRLQMNHNIGNCRQFEKRPPAK